MNDSIRSPADASDGGRKHLALASSSKFGDELSILQTVADDEGLGEVWSQIVTPWLEVRKISVAQMCKASEPSAEKNIAAATRSGPKQRVILAPTERKEINNLVVSFDTATPWQHGNYQADSALW